MTDVTIRFKDEDTTFETYITDAEEELPEKEDEKIFFYGLSREQCISAFLNKELCENEWYIVAVRDSYYIEV